MFKTYIFLFLSAVILTACSTSEFVTVKAEPEYKSYKPGGNVNVAFTFEMKDDWHIYWQNPGDAGLPTSIDWQLPEGFNLDAVMYPVPEKHVSNEIADYVYYPKATILTSFRLPKNLPADTTLQLTAYVKWLRCNNVCIPGGDTLTVEILVSSAVPEKSDLHDDIDDYIEAVFPFDSDKWKVHLNKTDSSVVFYISEKNGDTRGIEKIEFYPITEGIFSNNKEQKLAFIDGEFVLEVPYDPFKWAEPDNFEGIFVADKPWEDGQSKGLKFKVFID